MADAQMERTENFLRLLSEGSGVSGYESGLTAFLENEFAAWSDRVYTDKFGNLYAGKDGKGGKYTVMLAAHMDEVGLVVTQVDERGFIRFTDVAGIDARTLLGQEVVIHGSREVAGVIGSMPPHLLRATEVDQALKMENLGVDVALPAEAARALIQVGDIITIKRRVRKLLNQVLAGKSFDDRAGVAVMAVCLEELSERRFYPNVVAVATTQEEVGLRGAVTAAFSLHPDLGIAIDVTHAAGPDSPATLELGKGPAIALGANVHPAIYRQLVQSARSARLPYQVEPIPGTSGTDAWAMQVSREGIPTGLLSVPLRYMHTSVETLDLQDVVLTGKLLAEFIAGLPEEGEELLCF
ncbi:putative aminopeptidase YsdC [Peptococcaceae bacterium CEB3]|nr:putative aminopeptidase YsdC [Peptococcaceae bacterium CEB3]